MGCYLKIILTMMLIKMSQLSNREACSTSANFQLLANDSRADVPVILSNFAQFFSMCAHLCLSHKLCTSFNYNDVTFKCEILSYNPMSCETKRLVPSSGWRLYHKTTAKGCSDWQTLGINKDGFGCSCRDLENIALRKPTSQSSTCHSGVPSRAVDGNTATNYENNDSCTHTCVDPLMWWMVDLGRTALVQAINITNRGDCCGDRLSDFNIKIGDSAEGYGDANALCVSNVGVPIGNTKTFKCTSKLTGRYLYIKTNLQTVLTLCEVKVFGEYI